MSVFFNHQKTIGVVGTGPEVNNFIARANNLGFTTYQLDQQYDGNQASRNADKVFVGTIEDDLVHEEFIMKCDILVYFDDSMNSQQLEIANQSIVIPQGEDLLAIARDRVLQKAFKESIGVNIAPFETIVKAEDIKGALTGIGYPAVLRTNFAQPKNVTDAYFIYEEDDIAQASDLLKYGTCVLESWIVSEHDLSISVVKSASGDTQLYPIIKKKYFNERLSSIEKFAIEDEELESEIKRVANLIASNISFVGAITIDFIVSPAQALYIDDIHPYPDYLTRYSESSAVHSIIDAHLRAVTFLPLAEEVERWSTNVVYVPIYKDQKDLIDEWLSIYPAWTFHFYPLIKTEEIERNQEIGYILIEMLIAS